MKQIAVIIPAFNEAGRIAEVLRAVKGASHIYEIIVVNDGSSDNTSAEARKVSGVKVIDMVKNVGKGGAMAAGVASTTAQIIAFVDADLMGLKAEHIDQIIRPLLRDECDMCVGIFRGGKIRSNAAMVVTPWLSGQRAMKRELFEAIPDIGEVRFGVEVIITKAAQKRKSRVKKVILRGVSNCFKEEKLGLVKGLQARTKMYREIRQAMVRTRKKKRTHRNPFDRFGQSVTNLRKDKKKSDSEKSNHHRNR